MKRMIAMDVGGTKTNAILFDRTGQIHRRVVTLGANPLDVGFDEACRRYLDAIKQLREGLDAPIASIYGGIACIEYFKNRVAEFLQAHVAADVIRMEADGNCLISSMLGHQDGACLICGTGSSLCYRYQGAYGHIGGWGYLIDSCASGFILGKKAILAIVRAQDGRGEKTLLTALLAARCGMDIDEHFPAIYDGGRPYIASFAGLVFEARRAGDRVAAQIFDECIADLNELVWTAYGRFGAYPLVLGGGILQHFPEYAQALKAHAPQAVTMIDSDVPPVYGAAVEAMHSVGLTCDAAFRQRFLASYGK